ncbi:MAG: hypothetical protein K2X01_08740 [Cyanobacteria bacterium]|nr:hypothetical protein [Cyanobacteriota bacterium]
MNQPPSPPPSKLFIRSEVLAVIEFLATVETPSKQEKAKQIKRLRAIEDQKTVLEILLKELQRAHSSQRLMQVVSELLMEIGSIEHLHDPLWELIRSIDTRDEVKDAANLVLRHLGDQTDPDLYLEYLHDPQGLINRETERMLEVASRNPEALIDFIDFIFSLPVDEQLNLIQSLHADYEPDHLLNIYIPTMWADPPKPIQELILRNISQIRTKRAALFLYDYGQCLQAADPEAEETLHRTLRRAVNELRIAGIYRDDAMESYRKETKQLHELVQDSVVDKCYVTLSDGIGNQGLILSRKRANGDVVMMSVAINDMHGIIDCFGFYQLTEADFAKIAEKFHEESSKFEATGAYCAYKLRHCEDLNRQNGLRIPYEYSCWKVLLGDLTLENHESIDFETPSRQAANPAWVELSANLYHHPDFQTWFLEEGDHPVVTQVLAEVDGVLTRLFSNARQNGGTGGIFDQTEFTRCMDLCAFSLVKGLFTTDWKTLFVQRLADAVVLLNCQESKTFAGLAATEVMKLIEYPAEQEDAVLKTGFVQQFGRRCVEEYLLRRKQKATEEEQVLLTPAIEKLLDGWSIE